MTRFGIDKPDMRIPFEVNSSQLLASELTNSFRSVVLSVLCPNHSFQ